MTIPTSSQDLPSSSTVPAKVGRPALTRGKATAHAPSNDPPSLTSHADDGDHEALRLIGDSSVLDGEGARDQLIPDPPLQSMEALYDMVSSVVASELARLQAGESSPAGPPPSTPSKRPATYIALGALPKIPRLSPSEVTAVGRVLPAGTPAPPTAALQGDTPTSLDLSIPSRASLPILVAPSSMISATTARQLDEQMRRRDASRMVLAFLLELDATSSDPLRVQQLLTSETWYSVMKAQAETTQAHTTALISTAQRSILEHIAPGHSERAIELMSYLDTISQCTDLEVTSTEFTRLKTIAALARQVHPEATPPWVVL